MKRDLIVGKSNDVAIEDEETSFFMYVLTSIYMYLFVVVFAIVMAINSMAHNWEKDITGSITVQIIPVEDENKNIDKEKTLEQQNKVLQFMESLSVVKEVTVLDDKAINKLMTPWLGDKVDITTLPIPVLLDIRLHPDVEINYDEITRGLKMISSNATIDNHRIWLNRLLKFASSLRNIALSVLIMVIIICAFSIYYSTKTNLNINNETIEILHIVGAKDKYVAQQYAKIFSKIGFFSGVVGLLFGIPSILLVGKYGISTGSGLINGANLSYFAWVAILSTPILSSLYSRYTSYYTVIKTLEKKE